MFIEKSDKILEMTKSEKIGRQVSKSEAKGTQSEPKRTWREPKGSQKGPKVS